MIALPIDPFVQQIRARVQESRAVVVTAAPGAGKTTRLPPALVADGRVILLQPRRVAARSIAARIAAERGWTLGREVGWQVRFDRRFGSDTRLLVVTEGILTARLQTDPLLSDFTTIVVDEFHERSIHADLALALARQAWRARSDLRLVVMSATLEAAPVATFLDGCPIVDVPGRTHPIEIAYAPGIGAADAVADALGSTDGHVLCFMPGAAEIRRTIADLESQIGGEIEVVPLHGSLDPDTQDLALRPSDRRRVVVATNIAETSLTVPGVTAVVDTGLHKVARYDADRGIDSLALERITADSADQRAGRAGRIAPGIVRRLWDARDRLRPHREAEIHRIDLAATALEVIAWGGDPRTLEWFEAPDDQAMGAALALLERLRMIEGSGVGWAGGSGRLGAVRLTEVGERARRLPLHPRLARMLVAANGSRDVARACAILSERHVLPPRTASTTSDLLSALDRWPEMPANVQRAAAAIADIGLAEGVEHRQPQPQLHNSSTIRNQPIRNQSAIRNPQSAIDREATLRRAVLAGYPDRVAQRREPGSASLLLTSGTGATLARESGVHDGEFLVALDIHQSTPGNQARMRDRSRIPNQFAIRNQSAIRNPQSAIPLVRIASLVEREWLEPTGTDVVHRFEKTSGRVRAFAIDRYGALVLAQRAVPVDREQAAALLADAWLERGPDDHDAQLIRRLTFAGHQVDIPALVRAAAATAASLDAVRIANALDGNIQQTLERDAPQSVRLPSGRQLRLEYKSDGSVAASVKLQELFGLTDTPRVGRRREPVLLSLLAPNGRPVQVTRDLRSFWDHTYAEVRKELRGRYPKHRWPEDPSKVESKK